MPWTYNRSQNSTLMSNLKVILLKEGPKSSWKASRIQFTRPLRKLNDKRKNKPRRKTSATSYKMTVIWTPLFTRTLIQSTTPCTRAHLRCHTLVLKRREPNNQKTSRLWAKWVTETQMNLYESRKPKSAILAMFKLRVRSILVQSRKLSPNQKLFPNLT
jgi:hypothetical protein